MSRVARERRWQPGLGLWLGVGLLLGACVGDRFAEGDTELSDDGTDGAPGSDTMAEDGATPNPTDDGTDTTTDDEPGDDATDDSTTDAPEATDGASEHDAAVPEADSSSPEPPAPGPPDAAAGERDAGVAGPPAPDASGTAGDDAGLGNCETPMCADGSVTEPGADDECPDHPEQQRRGPCGCGFEPDARCAVLESLLAHRYSFSGQGNQVHDSVGGAHGETFNVQLDGSGVLNLNGNGAYAQLPEGVASARSSATFEVWARWDGGDANQRIFNFGTPDDGNGVPESFISLSPTSGADDRLTLSYRVGSSGGQTLRAPTGLPAGSVQHVAVVVDSEQGQLSVYVQGERLVQESTSQQLESLQDRVNWLGRALYPSYPYFRGVLDEFRIYAGALSADEIDMSLELGPSATFSR